MGFRYIFDEKKATQAAGILIGKSGGTINYMKLIKLIYLANREAFRQWGRPIVPDSYFSLPHGPILSKVLDLVSEQLQPGSFSFWQDHVSAPTAYYVKLMKDPGMDELNPKEIELLEEMIAQYGQMSEWELVVWCHKNLPEWQDPEGSCSEIAPAEILAVVGWEKDAIDKRIEEERIYQEESQALSQA
jgi:uncharacterized phage-associated protein